MKLHHGWAFPEADRFMMAEISPSGEYQRAQLDAALRRVTDWTMAIDAGAHIGTFAKVMSGRFEKVIAVEPSPDTFECLDVNLSNAGCTNVERRHVALGREPGFVHMELTSEQETRANTGARFIKPGGSIPVETIDSWELPSLGLLKMDVEGSEPAVLAGAKDTIKRCQPVILVEMKWLWTKTYGIPKDAVSKFLTHHGYLMADQVSRDQVWVHR